MTEERLERIERHWARVREFGGTIAMAEFAEEHMKELLHEIHELRKVIRELEGEGYGYD